MIEPAIRLRRAIYLKDVPLVRRIVKANPGLLQNPDYEDKSNTSLHLAAQKGLFEIAEVLLDAGHDSDEISRNAEWETPLMFAAANGNVEVGQLLIERCARSIPWTNKKGLDVLAIACLHQASTPLIPLLLQHTVYPASVHSRDGVGNTPLHHASASGSLKALRILLTAGADPNATNAYDWTPLAYSQTVAAEVYFKNLIAEFARQGQEEEAARNKEPNLNPVPLTRPPSAGAIATIGATTTERRRKVGGVRLITDDVHRSDKGVTGESGDAVTAGSKTWSPVQTRKAMTPTAGRGAAPWYTAGDNTRPRAESGG